jgi:hypothetical protein
MTDSLILGLSSGSACLATCGMVMFPYLMAGSAGVKKIAIDLALFAHEVSCLFHSGNSGMVFWSGIF